MRTLAATLALLVPLAVPAAGDPGKAPPPRTFKDADLQWGPCPEFIPKGCEIAVLNGDPARNNADIFFKVPGGFEIPQHWHNSSERMVLVSGEMTVRYEGQAPVTLKPGTYAYGPARLAHSATCAKGDPCVLFIAFELPVDAFPSQGPAAR
jgi:quercetin dioxygenase-like cupin family protein